MQMAGTRPAIILRIIQMCFMIRLMLCALALLSLLALPGAAESWIVQSVSQDIDYSKDKGCLQSSIQISGIEGEDAFIIQQINQKQEWTDLDWTDASFMRGRHGAVPRDINAAGLMEIMKDMRSKDNPKGIEFCRTNILVFYCLPDELQMDSGEGWQEIDMNSSRQAIWEMIACLDLIMANSCSISS